MQSNEFTSSSDTASVLLGEGGLSFAPALHHATGRRPMGVVVGDLDGDHLPDIASASWQDKSVGILRGIGEGDFEPYRVLQVGDFAKTVLSADFNGDGRLDLVADTPHDIIRVFLNGDGGTFTVHDLPRPGTNFPFGTTQSIAVGDLDGDGDTDLVRIQRIFIFGIGNVPTVAKYINQGNGTFTATQAVLPKNPRAILMGDPWHDGRDQYLLVNEDDTVTVNGTHYATGLGAQTIALGEVMATASWTSWSARARCPSMCCSAERTVASRTPFPTVSGRRRTWGGGLRWRWSGRSGDWEWARHRGHTQPLPAVVL